MSVYRHIPTITALAGFLGLAIGCASLPSSGIDPSGERLFSRSPFGIGENSSCPLRSPFENCELFGGRKKAQESLPETTTNTPAAPSSTPPPPVSDQSLPGLSGAQFTGTGVYSTTTATSPNRVGGISTAMIPEAADGIGAARPTSPISGPALIMTPHEQIAPVGSEVILVSSFLGNDQYLRTNEPVEWSLDGVGHIFSIDPGHLCDPLLFDYKRAKKTTDKFALTKTSSHEQTIRRGTTDPRDDIRILRGQSWISVNATKEGSTYVTAVATNMKDWSKRSDSATIHWVDAEWILPSTTIAAVGSTRSLTTTVRRKTNGAPRNGWVVRYEILGGPAVGFGPTRAQVQEVQTDPAGQATVELSQIEQMPGTSAISIKIIRPASPDGADRAVTLVNEHYRQVWASGGSLSIGVTGPPAMKLGDDLSYKIIVTNNAAVASGALVTLQVPPGMRYQRSVPPPIPTSIPSASTPLVPLQWELADLRPNESRVVEVTLVAERRGTFNVVPQVIPRTVYGTITTPTTTSPSTSPPSPVSPFPGGTAPPTVAPFPGGSNAGTSAANNPLRVRLRKLQSSELRSDDRAAMNVGLPTGAQLAAYALDVSNIAGRPLSNVTLRIYAMNDRNAVQFCSASSGTSHVNAGLPTERIELRAPSMPVGGSASFWCGFHILRPVYNQILQGEVLVDGQVVDRPTIVFSPM